MSNQITIHDLNTIINHEPRILDILVAESLGLKRPRDIRQTIEANKAELETYGSLAVSNRKSRGQETTEYYLNEEQALLLCMFSRTEKAKAARKNIITVYQDFRKGKLTSPATHVAKQSNLPSPDAIMSLLSKICESAEEAKGLGYDAHEALRHRCSDVQATAAQITRILGNPHKPFRGALIPQAAHDIITGKVASKVEPEAKPVSQAALYQRACRERKALKQLEAV